MTANNGGGEILPPLCKYGDLLAEWFMSVGPTMQSGMGHVPVSWAEIEAWKTLTGNDIDPWEAETLREASIQYSVQLFRSTDKICQAPWAECRPDAKTVSARLGKALDAMMKSGAKR